jgi:uncharacterized protein
MTMTDGQLELDTDTVDGIPVLWAEPADGASNGDLVLWLPWFTGTKDDVAPQLRQLADAGFVAVSLDPWQHGERGPESAEQLAVRVFSDFRRNMWPILGQTALDTLRVIDWATTKLGIRGAVKMGGFSMGGDIAIAAAGVDTRISTVAAVIATPDWLRPGMHDFQDPDTLLPAGEPDAYAEFFYDHLNPITNVARYAHRPAITVECGADDAHVPPDGAIRFRDLLSTTYPGYGDRIRVTLHPGLGHTPAPEMWDNCLDWLRQH